MIAKTLTPIFLIIIMIWGIACRQTEQPDSGPSTESNQQATSPENTPLPPAIATNTPIPPTPTPTEPMAALVNGQPIFLAEYERELARYMAAMGDALQPDYEVLVLDALIERELIRQAAASDGIVVSSESVDQRLEELRATAEETGGFGAWLEANQYTEEEFREALAAEMVTGEMVSRVTADVPTAVEQVRARYIQMDDEALAQSVLERARAGDDFAFLAEQNSVDRVTGEFGGDLGFFPPGSLLVPEVEQAAFALQPGEISDLITVTRADGTTVYYIVQTTERDPERELTADMRSGLLQAAFTAWIEQLRTEATVERFEP